MAKTQNRWSIPPAAQKVEREVQPLAVRLTDAAKMLSVSLPKFREFVAPNGPIVPIQPAGKGTTTLYSVDNLRAFLAAEIEKAQAALSAGTSATPPPK